MGVENLAASPPDASMSRLMTWMSARSPWQRRGLAFLAGGSATLAHAPFHFLPAYALALAVLVWLLDVCAMQTTLPRRLRAAFSTGWFFGIGHFSTGLYWISSAFLVDSEAWGPAYGVPAVAAMAAGLALFWGFGCALAIAFWTKDLRRLPLFAACIFVSEWLRGNILTGFPWLLPGYVWAPGEPVSQLASLVGIYGLSLSSLLILVAPASMADAAASGGKRFAPLLAAGLALGMAWGWGGQRLTGAVVDPPGARAIVRVTDSGMSQAEKWAPRVDQEWRVLQRYLEASGRGDEGHGAAIVIWPEGAIPVVNFFMLENPEFMEAIGRGLGDRALIVGLSRREMRGDELVYYNSAALIDGVSGVPRLGQIYDKNHLVPFGEYIPFWSLLGELNIAPLQRIGAGFEPGASPARLVAPDAPPATVLICYEAIFPGMIPRGIERPGWIVSVTNDAWFGDMGWFTGPWQHYAMARYRSIEEGLPMARAAAGGVSAIIDAYGREVSANWRSGGFAEAQIPAALSETTFAQFGNWLVLTLLLMVAGLRFLPPGRVARG